MPVSPWFRTHDVEAQRSYVALLGYVQVPTISMLPQFAWYGLLIDRQLRRSAGLIGFRTAVEFWSRKFLHLSAWADRDAIHRFVREPPHRRALETFVGRLGKTEFRYWTVTGSELPLDFKREMHRLATALPADRGRG